MPPPDIVKAQVIIDHVIAVNQKAMTLTVEGYELLWWWDRRLALKRTLNDEFDLNSEEPVAFTPDLSDIDQVWTPSIYAPNQVGCAAQRATTACRC